MRRPAIAALAFALATACGDTGSRQPLKLGLLMPVTGDLAARGRYFVDAALLVAETINNAGGLLGGRELTLVVKDTGTSPSGAMIGFTALLGEHVAAIIGPSSSAEAAALRLQIRAGETLMIGPSTSSSALSTLDFGGNFYRMVAPDVVQSAVVAELIEAASLTNLCIVARDDVYGNGIADGVQSKLMAPPATIRVARYDPANTDFSTVLDACGSPIRDGVARNGILFASLIADGAILMDLASQKYGWSSTDNVFLTDGTRDPDLIGLLANPSFVEGALGTAARGPDPKTPEGVELAAFQAAFSAKFGREADVYSEMAFDAAYVIAMAIEIAGTADDVDKIRDALAKISRGKSMAAGDWRAIAAEIDRSGELDYRGASGAVTLMPPSPDTAGPYFIEVWTIMNGVPTALMTRTITMQ